MTSMKRRIERLEAAAGDAEDMSFGGLVTRWHAQGKTVPNIIVQRGETVEEVAAREGITNDMPCIATIIVEPGAIVGKE